MKDLGLMHYFLGLEVWQRPGEIFLSQGKYVVKLLERFGMVHCKFVSTLMELNFKKLNENIDGPVLTNPTEYRQSWGPDFLSELSSGRMFCSEHLESTYG